MMWTIKQTSRPCAGIVIFLVLLAGLFGCNKSGETDVETAGVHDPYEEDTSTGPETRPHVPVPSIREYDWLGIANIKMGRPNEISSMTKKLEDYYTGYPSLMKVLALITKDRNVGLKDNPAYLSDVIKKYYELLGADIGDPFLATTDYDTGVLKNALFLSWKKENEFTPVDNYDDMVVSVTYSK